MANILVVEDDPTIRELVRLHLASANHEVITASDGLQGLQMAVSKRPDIIISDVQMPNMDGFGMLAAVRANDQTASIPVIFLTALDDRDSFRKSMNLGADDYLVKPFHLSELNARVAAVIRRRRFEGQNVLVFHDLVIDLLAKTVSISNKPVDLTRKEYELLLYLASNKNKVVSKMAIAEHLSGDSAEIFDNFDFIYTHMKNLKKKLTTAGYQDNIRSLYAIGYKFEV